MSKYLSLFSLVLMFVSCQQIDLGNSDYDLLQDDPDGKHKIVITSKSTVGEIPTPQTVYAVNEGKVDLQTSLTDNNAIVSLAPGKYTLYAVAGVASTNPAEASDVVLTMNEGFSKTPVMLGSKEVTVDKSGLSPIIQLSYFVASVDVTLTDVPDDVKTIVAEIPSLYETISLNKVYSGTTTAKLVCKKQGSTSTWKSDVSYVLPMAGDKTKLKITQTSTSDVVKSYTVEVGAPMEAGKQYHFKGGYQGNVTLNCELENAGWGEEVTQEFDYGLVEDKDNNPTYADGEYEVSSLPAAGSIWNGHVVAYMSGNVGWLLSLEDWKQPTSCMEIASAYDEDGIKDWSIPTLEQYKNILKCVSSSSLYDIISSVSTKKLDIGNYYYLCNDGQALINLSSGIEVNISNTNRKHVLRLLKEVTFKVK